MRKATNYLFASIFFKANEIKSLAKYKMREKSYTKSNFFGKTLE